MTANAYRLFDPLLTQAEAEQMVQICERHGAHGLYFEEGLNSGIGEGLPQRFDSAMNFVRTGGRFGRTDDDRHTLAARTNYFRETYAYGDEIRAPGIEVFLHHPGFAEAARGAVVGDLPERRELAKRLVDTYIHFPKPASLRC